MTETWGCIQPWASFDPLPIFINKVLLECRQAHLYTCCPWLLWGGTAQLSSNHEGWGNQIMYFLIWPLIEDVSQLWLQTHSISHTRHTGASSLAFLHGHFLRFKTSHSVTGQFVELKRSPCIWSRLLDSFVELLQSAPDFITYMFSQRCPICSSACVKVPVVPPRSEARETFFWRRGDEWSNTMLWVT